MTTFQIIIDSVFRVLSGILPLSYSWIAQFEDTLLHFTSTSEVELLCSLIVAAGLLIFFRFDWLALFSALMKSLLQPNTLKSEHRTLDQEILIFCVTVTLPSLLLHHWFAPLIRDIEFLNHPGGLGIFFLIGMGLIRFSYRWNKRIRGLNHLRLIDALPLILLSLLNAHPAFPLVMILWLGFSISNYHYEAIFKYSLLLTGIRVFIHCFTLMEGAGIREAVHSIGILNSIAVIALTFTLLWMVLDHLQKQFSENTLRSVQWLNLLAGLSSFALYFLKG